MGATGRKVSIEVNKGPLPLTFSAIRSLLKIGFPGLLLLIVADVHAEERVNFNRDIRSILSDNCFSCHGPDAQTREADLRLDREDTAKRERGGYSVIVAGSPNQSELLTRVQASDPDLRMPPPSSGKQLTPEEKQILERWIAEGAEYQSHWAFEPIHRVETNGNAIDVLIRRRLVKEGLKPSGPATPATQLRRLSLDLIGLPPTIAETDQFLADLDQQGLDTAYQMAVERLLDSPRFGEHMAWSWLEAARYADTDGYQNDGPREMWRWRDWVIRAFNQNLKFDQFTIEQLAGDQLPQPTQDQLIATAFNRNHRYNSEAGIPIDEFLLENAVDRVDTTSTVWMGLTMGCARCHDHKFDPLSQKEYYQLVDYFNDVAESGRAIKFGNSEPWIKTPTAEQLAILQELDAAVASSKQALEQAEAEIQSSQATWETATDFRQPLLHDGLHDHWTFDRERDESFSTDPSAMVREQGLFGDAVHVDAEHHLTLKPVHGLIGDGRFTISFWMKPADIQQGAVISNEGGNTVRSGNLVEFVEGRLRWNIIGRWIDAVQAVETQQALMVNQWIHVVLTNDGTQRTAGMSIYLNGDPQPVDEIYNTNSNKIDPKQQTKMRLGFSHHAPDWHGSIDELRFYTDRTLSPDEVRLLAVPESPPAIAAKPVSDRSTDEQQVLRLIYLEQTENESHRKLLKDWRAAKSKRREYFDRLPTTMIMRDRVEGRPSYIRRRGVYDQLGERVESGVPAVFPPLPNDMPSGRLAFARWLVSDQHPLTARVTMNRLWQSFFGRGIVRTPGDFGSQGSPPTHRELLDWLAAEFIARDWDLKWMIRQIVLSKTYRQSSQLQEVHRELDPENLLLARAPAIPLAGNILRDQALAVSGLLVEEIGGPSVKPYQPKNLWREASNFTYDQGKGNDLYRRSLYTYWKRTLAPPTMAILDTGDREYCTVERKRTNTSLQALALLNEVTFVESARKLAERILLEGGDTDQQRVVFAFRTVAVRFPTAQEKKILVQALQDYRIHYQDQPELAARLLETGDSQVHPELDKEELAAATALANVLLNLDEVTTRE